MGCSSTKSVSHDEPTKSEKGNFRLKLKIKYINIRIDITESSFLTKLTRLSIGNNDFPNYYWPKISFIKEIHVVLARHLIKKVLLQFVEMF